MASRMTRGLIGTAPTFRAGGGLMASRMTRGLIGAAVTFELGEA